MDVISISKILMVLISFSFGKNKKDSDSQAVLDYAVEVFHPGLDTDSSIIKILTAHLDSDERIIEFSMKVKTVLCGDSECKIDTVQIVWNPIGDFSRLEIPPNVSLEKAEGIPFSKDDYYKLNEILRNKNSSLKEVFVDEVVGTESSDGVDGITGATILVHNDDYIKGAVWTCYTLWHWVNGNIVGHIREISGSKETIDTLKIYLTSSKRAYFLFALEELTKRKNYHSQLVDKIIDVCGKSNNLPMVYGAIQYLEGAPDSTYYSSMIRLSSQDSYQIRNKILHSLTHCPKIPNHPFLKDFTTIVKLWEDLPSLLLYLQFLEKQESIPSEVIAELGKFIKSKSFIVARATYWLLVNQDVDNELQAILSEFHKNNKDRL